MREYPASLRTLDLLNILCKLGMGYAEDKPIIGLSLDRWYVFDNYNAKMVLMTPDNAFITKTSIASMMVGDRNGV